MRGLSHLQYETPASEHAHLSCILIRSGMLYWSNISLVLAHKHLFNLFQEGIAIVDNFTSPSISSLSRNLFFACVRI